MGNEDTPRDELPAHHGDSGPATSAMLRDLSIDLRREIRESRKLQGEGLGAVVLRLTGIENRMQEGSLRLEKHSLQIGELAMAAADSDKRLESLERIEFDRAKKEFAAGEVERVQADTARNALIPTLGTDAARIIVAGLISGLCGLVWWGVVTWIRSGHGG
jgi:hypothetical protein